MEHFKYIIEVYFFNLDQKTWHILNISYGFLLW